MSYWLLGIVLGVVQGISEWLPISSKTQVMIASKYLFGLSFADGYALGLFLEAGTFFAATIYFREEVVRVLKALVGRGDEEGRMLLKYLVVVTAVTALIGVIIYKAVSETVSGPIIGVPMIALGSVLIGDGLLITIAKKRYVPKKSLSELGLTDLLLVGIAQGIAAFPGVSRSGATVSAMLLLGIKPQESFRLSFLALIPASVGATAVTVIFTHAHLGEALTTVTFSAIAIAILITVLIGTAFIGVLLKAAGSNKIALLTFSLGILAVFGGVLGLFTGAG